MYVRTKDKIYELKENMTIENAVSFFFGKFVDLNEKHLFRNDNDLGEFVSQSENIEELCDEFIVEWLPTNHKDIFKIDEYSKEVIKSCIGNSNTKVYGAVWTSKGLIFSAKMNDKGDWELI